MNYLLLSPLAACGSCAKGCKKRWSAAACMYCALVRLVAWLVRIDPLFVFFPPPKFYEIMMIFIMIRLAVAMCASRGRLSPSLGETAPFFAGEGRGRGCGRRGVAWFGGRRHDLWLEPRVNVFSGVSQRLTWSLKGTADFRCVVFLIDFTWSATWLDKWMNHTGDVSVWRNKWRNKIKKIKLRPDMSDVVALELELVDFPLPLCRLLLQVFPTWWSMATLV